MRRPEVAQMNVMDELGQNSCLRAVGRGVAVAYAPSFSRRKTQSGLADVYWHSVFRLSFRTTKGTVNGAANGFHWSSDAEASFPN